MIQKTPVPYAFGPNFSSMFNWGLRLKNTEEIFLASGLGAHDSTGTIHFPGDAVAQTQFILEKLPDFLASAGFSKNDIVRMEFTFTKDVPAEKYDAIFGKFIEFLSTVPIKPAVGTLRVVSALVFENQLVEYEFWCAR
jgi:enamine deaminase RidA (YjgF/YER057c/UK114 family)